MRKILDKKGQLNLGDAPTVILLVGLTFLVLATIALIGEKYGAAVDGSLTATIINESVTQAELTAGSDSVTLDTVLAGYCNPESYSMTAVLNNTDGTTVGAGNYSLSSTGILTNLTDNSSDDTWDVSYTFKYGNVACNVTADLQTEVSNNTSIAGIILTISLVGIILAILIGVFLGVTRRARI